MRDAELVRSSVVDDPTTVLEQALAENLTGYAHVEPQDAFLLGDDVAARIVFDGGVPIRVEETTGTRTGPAAVETLVGPGPYAAEVYRRPDGLDDAETGDADVPPDLPARRFGDDDLADRTRTAAPGHVVADDPVTSFLDDEAAVESIREAAREEALDDAREWGLTDHLAVDDADDRPAGGQ